MLKWLYRKLKERYEPYNPQDRVMVKQTTYYSNATLAKYAPRNNPVATLEQSLNFLENILDKKKGTPITVYGRVPLPFAPLSEGNLINPTTTMIINKIALTDVTGFIIESDVCTAEIKFTWKDKENEDVDL